jgi:hypothetical protein
LAATASPLLAQDLIKFKDPKKDPDLEGEIVSLSFKRIEIQALGVKQVVDARLVAEIITTRKTFDFVKGEEAMANGDTASALQRFERVVADPVSGEVLRQTAALQILRAHASLGVPKDVVHAAQLLRTGRPESFFLHESYQQEVRAQLAVKNPAGAKAAIGALAALAKVQELPLWGKSAELLDAELSELQANWRGALPIYRKYARDPDVGEDAAFGELRCLTAISDFPGLNARADAVLKDAEGWKKINPRLLIAATTAKGDVEMNGGKTKEALLHYLRGAMAMGSEKSPEHETALARSALTCAKVSTLETDAARKALFRVRTQELSQELNGSYPDSKYREEVDRAFRALR